MKNNFVNCFVPKEMMKNLGVFKSCIFYCDFILLSFLLRALVSCLVAVYSKNKMFGINVVSRIRNNSEIRL